MNTSRSKIDKQVILQNNPRKKKHKQKQKEGRNKKDGPYGPSAELWEMRVM